MATIRTAANTVLVGRVGDKSFYVADGRQIARQRLNNSNYGEGASRTQVQQERRIKWANQVNFYKASSRWMKSAYENRKKGQTDYNKFVQLNINNSKVALTKELAAAGACVVEPYLISQGSLPSIDINPSGSVFVTNIAYPVGTINESTTVGEFSSTVVAANNNITFGMQLTFVSYMQLVDPLGVPRVTCTAYEVSLDGASTETLRDYLPAFCSQVVTGYLGTSDAIAVGGFAYILSDNSTGKLRVSTQILQTTNNDLQQQYSSPTAVADAVMSYGVDADVMLSPSDSVSQDATPKPIYIQSAFKASTKYVAGNVVGSASTFTAGVYGVTLSENASASNVSSVILYTKASASSAETPNTLSTIAYNSKDIVLTGSKVTTTNYVSRIVVVLATGSRIQIEFGAPASGGDSGELDPT